MIRLSLSLLIVVALAFPVAAQTTAPSPASAGVTPGPSKRCVTARKKEDKEQRSLTAAIDAIAKDTKGRESCSSKSMCARYDDAISAMQKRQARHETRLARFKEEVDSECKVP